MRRRIILISSTALLAVLLGVGLYLFQPWRLFTSSAISEAIPTHTAATPPIDAGSVTKTPEVPAGPVVLAVGTLISHEHASSGTVKILRLPDGSQIIRFENLVTSDGPDLRIWLTDAPVIDSTEGWYVFDDGNYLDLGPLKANKGDQNYVIPPGTDLSTYSSVSIWCARFAVSFAAADLPA